VEDVTSYKTDVTSRVFHKVSLECIDDDILGKPMAVIWQHEPHTQIREKIGFPKPEKWDRLDQFNSFITAIQWSTSSLIEGPEISAPFRAAIELDDFQLEPLVKALLMPRVNLLIADDVGLGKTIEAGLVAQELLSRQVIRKILIICPASLQRQWKEEMESKFQLEFEIIDRGRIQRLRKEYGIHVNPWNSSPRIITSVDFIKREQPLRLFRQSLKSREYYDVLKDWDLLIIDEAHNIAPSGRRKYIRDSARTKAIRAIIENFENKLFLTATPHNGFTESFTALLELLDPLRFSRGPVLDKEQVKTVMVRRLKDDIEDALGKRRFTKRKVVSINIDEMKRREAKLHENFKEYRTSRLNNLKGKERLPVTFTLTLLKKRQLSSPLSFSKSIDTHIKNLKKGCRDEAEGEENDISLVKRLHEYSQEDWDNDDEKSQREDDVIQESSKFFTNLSERERELLGLMQHNANYLVGRSDGKMDALLSWIDEKLCPDGEWHNERLLLFTEYKDTLEYIENIFKKKGWKDRIIKFYGGMGTQDREIVKATFQASPDENSTRILLATDAASEGLNLQKHCRYLIHYEIPWNPNRMEQRNGRIDRHGQKAPKVFVHHFTFANNEDYVFLNKVVKKVQTMREDLGSVGEVIAKQVENVMLGFSTQRELNLVEKEDVRKKVREEIKAEIITKQRIHELSQKLVLARKEWKLYPENLKQVLDEALKLKDHRGLEPITGGILAGKGYKLLFVPEQWKDCYRSIKDAKGRLLTLVFDHDIAKDRKDTVLIHLNHPLMKRALGTFRSHLWSEGLRRGKALNRVSYSVFPDHLLSGPMIIAFGRMVVMSELGQKLHESIIRIGAEISKDKLSRVDEDIYRDLIDSKGEHPEIPKAIGNSLRGMFPLHEKQLQAMLKEAEKTEKRRIKKLLSEKARKEAKAIKILMKERIKEIQKRLSDVSESMKGKTLKDFGLEIDEQEQWKEDIRWLERKLEDLKKKIDSEPQRVKRKYRAKSVRVFPLGILYLLPNKLISEGE